MKVLHVITGLEAGAPRSSSRCCCGTPGMNPMW